MSGDFEPIEDRFEHSGHNVCRVCGAGDMHLDPDARLADGTSVEEAYGISGEDLVCGECWKKYRNEKREALNTSLDDYA